MLKVFTKSQPLFSFSKNSLTEKAYFHYNRGSPSGVPVGGNWLYREFVKTKKSFVNL